MKLNIKKILNKHVYRIVPVVVAFVIVLSCFLYPVSAESASTRAVVPDAGTGSGSNSTANIVDPFTDIVTSSTTDNVKTLYVRNPATGTKFSLKEYSIAGGYSSTILNQSGYSFFIGQFGPRYLYNGESQVDGYKYDLSVDLFSNGYYISCLQLDSTSNFELTLNLDLDSDTGFFNYPTLKSAYIYYYNSNFVRIGSYSTSSISSVVDETSGLYKAVFDIDKPENALYCSFRFNLTNLEFFNTGFGKVVVDTSLETKLNVIPNRPTPVSFFDVVDDSLYDNGYTYYVVNNDDQIGSVRLTSSVSGYEQVYGDNFNSISFPGVVGDTGNYNINWRMFQPIKYLQLGPIVSGAYSLVNFKFSVETDYDFYFPNIQVVIYYYSSDFSSVGFQRNYVNRDYIFVDDNSGEVRSLFEMEIPENAEYMAVSVIMQSFRLYGNTSQVPVTITVDDYAFGVEIENYSYYYGEFLIDSANRLGALGGELSVSKPSFDDVNTSIDSLVDRNVLLVYTGVLSQFWRSNTLTAIVVSVFTLTLISFIVFGKK